MNTNEANQSRRRHFISDYGAAFIAESIGLAGLCIGLGLAKAESMWALVIIWAVCFGPSESLRDASGGKAES